MEGSFNFCLAILESCVMYQCGERLTTLLLLRKVKQKSLETCADVQIERCPRLLLRYF